MKNLNLSAESAVSHQQSSSHGLARLGAAAILLLVLALLGSKAQAATYTWDGSGGNNNWSTGANWTSGFGDIAPNGDDNLHFAGSTRLTSANNLTGGGLSQVDITFDAGAGAFTISGTALTLSGGLVNNSANTQTIDLGLTFSGSETFSSVSGGTLVLGGAIGESGGGTKTITLSGAGNFIFNGNFGSGAGTTMALTMSGSGQATLNAANTYTAGTTLNSGTLALGAANALGSGVFNFAGGTLKANSFGESAVGALTLTGASVLDLSGNAGTHGSLTFASGSGAGTLTILGWTGPANATGTDDHIFITANPGATFLSQISFSGYASGATWLSGTGEIVPVPEPVNVAMGIFGLCAVGAGAGRKYLRKRS